MAVQSRFETLPVHRAGIRLAKFILKADLVAGPKIPEDGDCAMNAGISQVICTGIFM